MERSQRTEEVARLGWLKHRENTGLQAIKDVIRTGSRTWPSMVGVWCTKGSQIMGSHRMRLEVRFSPGDDREMMGGGQDMHAVL